MEKEMHEAYFMIGGVCIGIRSELSLDCDEKWRKFRIECAEPTLKYTIRYVNGAPKLHGELVQEGRRASVYQKDGMLFPVYRDTITGEAIAVVKQTEPMCWEITADGSRMPWGSRVEHFFEIFALPHVLLQMRRFWLHCSYIVDRGEAILFTAPSGTGKSTQADLWKKYRGARIINGDRGLLEISGEKLTVHGLPVSGSSDYCENVSAPVKAIVVLEQAPENRIQPIEGMPAVRALLRGTYLLPEFSEDFSHLLELADEIRQRVPIYLLQCLPNEGATRLLFDTLEAAKFC